MNVVDNAVIGYSLQFDALALDLTGQETLELVGKLNGFQDAKQRSERVLNVIDMVKEANKLVQYYRFF